MSTLNLGNSLIMNSDIVVNGGEIKTGATFNGKPVYANCQEYTLGTDTTPVTVAHNIANVFDIIDIKGFGVTSEPTYYPVQWYNGGAYFGVYASRTSVVLRTSLSTLYGKPARIILYYTKTTD